MKKKWESRLWIRAVLFALFQLSIILTTSTWANAASVQKLTPSKRTGKVRLVTQNITFSRHDSISISPTSLDAQLRAGSRALQVKDSAADIPCRVKLQRSGNIGVFSDFGIYTFAVIDTSQESLAIESHVSQLVKIVGDITVCAGVFGSYAGCARPGNILIRPAPADPLTLVHEFGHHKGIGFHDSNPERIMFGGAVSGPEVTTPQCEAFKQ